MREFLRRCDDDNQAAYPYSHPIANLKTTHEEGANLAR